MSLILAAGQLARGKGWHLLLWGVSRATARPASRQSAFAALGLAVGVAVAGAVIWGLVAMLLKVQLSLLGVLIGFGVGAVVARYRAGHWPTIIAGAVIAVAGCAFGVLLGLVFVTMNAQVPLSFILGHLGGSNGLLHFYPSAVGGLGLVFWLIAAGVAIRIPMQSQRIAARAAGMTPVWGQTPNAAMQAGDLPAESARPMFAPPPGTPSAPASRTSTAEQRAAEQRAAEPDAGASPAS